MFLFGDLHMGKFYILNMIIITPVYELNYLKSLVVSI